jgi:hypothetical protein
MVQKGIVFLMVGLLSVSVLGGAALARVVSASTQGGSQGPCVTTTSVNGTSSALSNNSTSTWCIEQLPTASGNGTGIIFTIVPSGGIPPGYGMSCSFTDNTEGCTISPPSTGTPYTGPPPVNQNTTQTTTSTQ